MIDTTRLRLRLWRDDDLPAFAAMNADPRVMEFFSSQLTREQSDDLAGKIRAGFERDGFGLWAVELPGGAEFIGFIGMISAPFEAAFTPCVEVGWRLAADHWGKGYATEGARAVIAHGFETEELDELVSMTTVHNRRSRRVMEKLGFTYSPTDDFEHPLVPEGHPLRPHVLYRLSRSDWQAGR